MKRLLFLLACVASLNGAVNAGTIIWGSQNGAANWLSENDGTTLLPVNNFVRLGYFNGFSTLAQLDSFISSNSTTAAGLQTINSSFNQVDVDQIGADSFNRAGVFANSGNVVNPDTNSLVGKQLVIMAYFSSNTTTLANALSTAQQFGVFYFNSASNANWAIKSDNPTPSSATIDVGNLTDGTTPGNLVANAHIPAGRFSTTTTTNPGPAHPFALGLVSVPEPSAAVLLGFGFAGLLSYRRFRRLS